jgi:hypothetical protein
MHLLRKMGIETIYPNPNLSRPQDNVRKYPYLLSKEKLPPQTKSEHRYNLHSTTTRVCLLCSSDRLVQQIYTILEIIQHHGNDLLLGRFGEGLSLVGKSFN